MEANREKIIVVDDDRTNLTVVRNALIDKYDVFTLPSGAKLFSLLDRLSPDLILLDVEMPDMDGYDVIKGLKSSEKAAYIPVIFLTAMNDPDSEIKGLNLGAIDYLFKPFSRELLLKKIELHLLLESQKRELKRYGNDLEGIVFEKTQAVFELQHTILKTVVELVERRDNITGGHIERTQTYLRLIIDLLIQNGIYAQELSSWDIDLFVMSSQLHDVGKISIKDSILMKQGKLSDEEFEEMKKHTVLGKLIIERIEESTTENAFLEHAKFLAGSHHEKWDGTGYPCGLKGDDIPLQGRLMAIVDVYDALTSDRPYKKALSHGEAMEKIKNELDGHFDPLIREVFIRYEKEFAVAGQSGYTREHKPMPSSRLNTIFETASNIAGVRGSAVDGYAERIRRYLKIFLDALLGHGIYSREIMGWDIEEFLMSAQLRDIVKIDKLKARIDDENLLRHAEELAASRHERWDGAGYPEGLKGRDIPLQ